MKLKPKIQAFLDELQLILEMDKDKIDFSDLYARHPEVNIGIRRAILYLKKQKEIYEKYRSC